MDGNLLIHLAAISYGIALLANILINRISYSGLITNCCNLLGCFFTVLSFLTLVNAYIFSDLSLVNVVANSSPLMPLHYRIAAVWANYEGSMLLLILYCSVFSVLFQYLSCNVEFFRKAQRIQIIFSLTVLIFIITQSNPFVRSYPIPRNALGLNPTLQDSNLIIHPPILYLAHAGCFIIYSICLSSRHSKALVSHLIPWVFVSLGLLTLGIGLGSWWAYKEIGWGGFWFWDPVETISLFPWLTLVALMHACKVRDKSMPNLTIFLGIISFISVLFGLFIVRAGLLKSVHSFAQDINRGSILLMICLAFASYGFWEFSKNVTNSSEFKSKITRIIFSSNMLWLTSLAVVFLGAISPLIHELIYSFSITVEPRYFNQTFNTLVISSLLLCIAATSLMVRERTTAVVMTCAIVILVFAFLPRFDKPTIGYLDILAVIGVLSGSYITSQCILAIKKSNFYMMLSHAAFGIGILAIATSSLLSDETQFAMKVGDVKQFKEFKVSLVDVLNKPVSNYITKTLIVEVDRDSQKFTLQPELRIFPLEKQMTSKPAILRQFLYDLHLNINSVDDNVILFSVYYRPMMNWLWLSILITSLFLIIRGIKICYSNQKSKNIL